MTSRPLALFAACDRHNFGDLLFPPIAAALLRGRPCQAAGLAAWGGACWGALPVSAIGSLSPPPQAIVHAGGEVLDCGAWEAAVMLCDEATAATAIRRFDTHPASAAAWAARRLGTADRAPYVLGAHRCGSTVPRLFTAVGGSCLAARPPEFIAEVVGKLRSATHVGVRDRTTRDFLASQGISADLAPDPAVLAAELFGDRLRHGADHGEVAALRRHFAAGYLALQFSADSGDDATLDTLASQLRQLPAELGIVLFRAGAAPWHDDAAVYARLAARLGNRPCHLFASLNIWDIAALLAQATAYAGSSLHGRIVASACAVPAVSLHSPGGTGKVRAYLATWHGDNPLLVAPAALADGLGAARAVPLTRRREQAETLAERYRAYVSRWAPLVT